MAGGFLTMADFVPSKSRVHRQGGEFDTGQGSYQYAISVDEADTPKRVLKWVAHVGRKNWVTPKMLADFIELACPNVYAE